MHLPLSCDVRAIRQEASTRRYYRLVFATPFSASSFLSRFRNSADFSAPRYRTSRELDSVSMILCATDPQIFHRSDFFIINEYLDNSGIPVPRIHACLDSMGVLFLEDGGGRDLNDHLRMADGADLASLRQVTEILAALHRLKSIHPVSDRFFDYEKFSYEMNFLFENYSAALEKYGISYRIEPEVRVLIDDLIVRLSKSGTCVFTHRDFHTRNILRGEGERPWNLIDYQDARMGHPCYDLSSFLYDPYIEFDVSTREIVIGYYESASGCKIERALLYEHALQRLLKALGTYLHMTFVKNHPGYLQSISPTLRSIDDLTRSMGLNQPFRAFIDMLSESVLNKLKKE